MTRNARSIAPAYRTYPQVPASPEAQTFTQQHPERSAVGDYRQYIHLCMPQCLIGELNTFLKNVFANDDLVRAYVQPARPHQSPKLPQRLVVHQSMADANRTRSQRGFLHPYEREVAVVAAFVYRCGYYLCAQQGVVGRCLSCATPAESPLESIRNARQQLLEEPLRQLRRSTPVLGDTLGQVLGLVGGDDCDGHQVARIQAAMCSGLLDQH